MKYSECLTFFLFYCLMYTALCLQHYLLDVKIKKCFFSLSLSNFSFFVYLNFFIFFLSFFFVASFPTHVTSKKGSEKSEKKVITVKRILYIFFENFFFYAFQNYKNKKKAYNKKKKILSRK